MAEIPETYDLLRQALGPDRVRTGEVLAPYTTFRIGGPADLYYEARSADELARAILAARSTGCRSSSSAWAPTS